jgi:hypothetical protein
MRGIIIKEVENLHNHRCENLKSSQNIFNIAENIFYNILYLQILHFQVAQFSPRHNGQTQINDVSEQGVEENIWT